MTAGEIVPPYFSVKEAVFPFIKFPGVDTILGPEMKSTGEVMGVGESFGEAFVEESARRRRQVAGRRNVVHQRQECRQGEGASRSRRCSRALGFTLVATTTAPRRRCPLAGVPVIDR